MNKPRDNMPLEDTEPPISDAIRAELLRRRARPLYDEQREAARPADEVLADIAKKYGLGD